jgi:hypothetical protein
VSPGTSLTGPLQGWYYYRNLTERDFRAHIDFEALFAASFFLFNPYSRDLYFAGQKRCGQPVFHFDAPVLRLRCHEELEVNQRLVGAKRGFKPLSLLAEAPLRIAMYLPDRHFQNFAVPYSRFVNRIRALRRDALRKNP